ncbi:MAG: hypothetical protein HQM11_04035 [SAR324 cluster bacterium]|nr:hypothetical protein [SAR324 cluster bacterium]
MILRIWFWLAIIICLGQAHPHSLRAQTDFFSESQPLDQSFNYQNDLMSGFSEDGRIKILLLTLMPSGMTETASEEILRSLYLNLSNTNHFTLVGPSEWNAQMQMRNPSLADCHDIACGIDLGKQLSADKIMVGRISAQKILDEYAREIDGMILSIRVIDVVTNRETFVDEVQFTDADIQSTLFALAQRVSANTLLRGHVLNMNENRITTDLGLSHGLKKGLQMVIYKETPPTVNLDGQTIGAFQENIAIAQVHRLNDASSELIVLQQMEEIKPGYFVKTFINFARQIEMIAEVRSELDTQKRLMPKTKPIPLVPELVVQKDDEKEKWARRVIKAKEEEKRWMIMTGGGFVATLIILQNDFSPFTNSLNQFLPHMAGGITLYAGYQYIQQRKLVSELIAEGRVKGYFSQLMPSISAGPEGLRLAWNYQF